jgi:hypothetical protein
MDEIGLGSSSLLTSCRNEKTAEETARGLETARHKLVEVSINQGQDQGQEER